MKTAAGFEKGQIVVVPESHFIEILCSLDGVLLGHLLPRNLGFLFLFF
jgi:hypothetical protein